MGDLQANRDAGRGFPTEAPIGERHSRLGGPASLEAGVTAVSDPRLPHTGRNGKHAVCVMFISGRKPSQPDLRNRTDPMPPSRWCDGALRVLSARRSRRQRAQRARKNVQVAGARILGSGLNCLDASFDTQAYLPGY